MSKKSTHFTGLQVFQKGWHILKPIKKLLLLRIFISSFSLVVWSIISIFMKFIIDDLINGKPFSEIIIWIGIFFFCRTLANFFDWLDWKIGFKVDRLMSTRIENHASKLIMNFSVGQFVNEKTGIKVSAINRGARSLKDLFSILFVNIIPRLAQVLILSLALFIFGWKFGLIGLTLIVINLILFKFGFLRIATGSKKIERQNRYLDGHKWEVWHNIDLVKQSLRENVERSIIIRKVHKIWDNITLTWGFFAKLNHLRSFLTSLIYVSSLILGLLLIEKGQFTVGSLVVIIGWMRVLNTSLRTLSRGMRQLFESFEPVRALFEMLDTPPAITFPDSAPKPDFQGHIKFQNVSFNYESNKPALKHVTFEIKPGQQVAFVGESGSGKTTITRLLQRFYDPTSGKILIDGQDLKSIHLPTFLQQTGIVSQDVKLFDTTLKKNIIYSLPKGTKVSQAKLKEIINQSRINKFWHRLSKGFDTLLGENGIKLSGGEKQRVSIARALIKNPKLLIFDEATSSLDVESESEIQKAIRTISKGRTTIIVAHRLSTIISADHIFVMSKGKLVGQGTHLDLMKSNKIYANLMQIQVRDLLSASFPDLDNKGMNKILKDLKII